MSSSASSSSSRTAFAVIVVAVVMTMMVTLPSTTQAFTVPRVASMSFSSAAAKQTFRMSSNGEDPPPLTVVSDPMADALEGEEEEEEMDEELRKQLAKQKRAQELREQEVFMQKSTGIHKCTNCDWQYDETKGDSMMIGGMVKPDTAFEDLPADWRCPVCRASKDAFVEVVEEIPGFEVNQGYGFGTNSWTAGQKNLAIFGGLGVFFLLFLSGYAMS